MRTLYAGIFISATAVGSALTASAQFPDYYGENYKAALAFYENQGRKINSMGAPESSIMFSSEAGTPELDLKKESTVSVVWSNFGQANGTPVLLNTNRIDIHAVGELSSDVTPTATDQASDHLNVYSEEYPTGLTGIPGYQRIIYDEVYPGIAMHAYSGHAGAKLAFHCDPGSDPGDILLNFSGQDSLHINIDGALRMYLNQQWIQLSQAVAYQYDGTTIIPVNWTAGYEHNQGSANVKFGFDDYDTSLPLVFLIGQEPFGGGGGGGNTAGLLWSSYYSGNGWDELLTVDHDSQGNIYAGGYTYTGLYPVTVGTTTNPGAFTGTLVAFNSNYQRLWATMYGGSSADEVKSLFHSGSGQYLYATGYTASSDFPTIVSTGAYNYSGSFTQYAPYIMRVSASTGGVSWCTRLGSGRGLSITSGPGGSKYLVGYAPSAGLPAVAQSGSLNQTYGGGTKDGTLFKFNSSDQLVWSTYVGGSGGDEFLEGVCVDATGNVFIMGMTNSTNFPQANPGGGAFTQSSFGGGGTDIVILRFNAQGQLGFSSYYGGSGGEVAPVNGCIRIGGGKVYLVGGTLSNNFPTQTYSGAFNDGTYNGGESGDGFIIVMNASSMARLYATYLGGSATDGCYGVSVDDEGDAFVVGLVGDGLPVTQQAGLYGDITFNNGLCGSQGSGDGFILRLESTTLSMLWATYFGGIGCDGLWGVDCFGSDRVAVVGSSGDSPNRPFFDPGNEAWYEDGTDGFFQSTIAELNIIASPVGFGVLEKQGLSAIPNPTNGPLRLVGLNANHALLQIAVVDGLGRVCHSQTTFSDFAGTVLLDLSNLKSGVYVARISTSGELLQTARVVVNHE